MTIKVIAWQRAIVYIDEMNLSRLSYRMDMTYSHLVKIAKAMKQRQWIIVTKKGRENHIVMTEKGEKVREACITINNELKIQGLVR